MRSAALAIAAGGSLLLATCGGGSGSRGARRNDEVIRVLQEY